MAITIPSASDVADQVLAFFRNRFPGKDVHTESFLGKIARAFARSIAQFHRSVQSADNDAVPSTSTSTAGLDNQAYTYGLTNNTAGQYGRKPATIATGGVAPCTGTNGTVFPNAITATAPDGVTIVALSGSVTISGSPPGTGSVNGNFVAVTVGTAGNLDAGTVLTWQSTPSGADDTVTLSSPLAGAVDQETDAALLARLFDRLQQPPKGGTVSDYKTWAETVDGVFIAYVYPLRGGTGTVHTVVTASGSGTGRKPSSTVQTSVDNYINGTSTIEGQRPVTVDDYETLLPYMPAANGLTIRVRVTPSLSKYAFEWALANTTFTVASYSAGVVTTNEALPTTLKAAVDAGSTPRIQILATGGPVLPVQVRVTAYNSGAKTLTLESPLPSGFWAPTAADPIYPGGPVVDETATELLAYVDGLGPSRAGGYASVIQLWEDTASIFRLGQTALDAKDTDGTKLNSNVIAAMINGSATDVEATDTTANGPQLLYAKFVAVTD